MIKEKLLHFSNTLDSYSEIRYKVNLIIELFS